MKKGLLLGALMMSFAASSFAYTTLEVKDSISVNTHWTNDQQYLLKGYVYVTSGATLTIDSGTIIKGDKPTKGALIVERGAKLIAVGSPTAPIVFTSNQPAGFRTLGDWGGVILCGKAPTNWTAEPTVEGGPRSKYGGTNIHDNSGRLSYVRIEFPGIAFSPNNEVNGLTFCGVGDSTQIDHIQVSYSGDDSYEWFGGSVNAKYLIALRTWDDDFDTDAGYTGKNQFVVSLRDPFFADNSGSKAFESDSYQPGGVTASGLTDTNNLTKPVFSNVTIAGPMINPTSTAYDLQFTAAIQIRRGSALSIVNSIEFGYPCGILWDESAATMGSTTANIANNAENFRNNIVSGNATYASPTGYKDVFYVKDGARSLTPTTTWGDTTGNVAQTSAAPFTPFAGPYSWLFNAAYGNKTYPTEQNGVRLQNPFNLTNPDFRPTSTSPVAYNTKGNGSATAGSFNPANPINTDTTNNYQNYNVPLVPPNFTTTKANDAFFTKVNFIGAFSGNVVNPAENWVSGWSNFDPQNTNYNVLNTTSVTTVVNKTVQNAKLFPNPASENATLLYELNGTGNVRIFITDLSGRVVRNIFEGVKNAGISNIEVNLSGISNGMYFMNIASENGQKAVKFNVAK